MSPRKIPHAKVSLILVITLLALSSPIIISQGQGFTFTVIIDKDVVGDYTLVGVVLALPGIHGVEPDTVIDQGDMIRVTYRLSQETVSDYLRAAEGSISSPTITILLVDYENNRSMSIIVTSGFLVSLSIGEMDPERIIKILEADPLAGLRIERLEIDRDVFNKLEKYGYVFTSNRVPGSNIPVMEWEETLLTAKSCGWDAVVDPSLGIYYAKNWNHPAASQEMPAWFEERFVRVGGGLDAEFYWEKFRDRLVAAAYYVPMSVDLNDAIHSIADWAMWPNDPNWRGSTALLPLEAFVGVNNWIDSLPPTVYTGWITLFSYKIENHVDTQNSINTLGLTGYIVSSEFLGSVSGLLVDGLFVSTESSSSSSVQCIDVNVQFEDSIKYFAVIGSIHSPGDYIITTWKVAGTVTCNGATYRVVIPRTITAPLYSVSLDYSTLQEFGQNPSSPEWLVRPGVSILLSDYKYNPDTYRGWMNSIYDFKLTKTSSQLNYGYNAIVGNPVFKFILTIYDYAATRPYEKLAVDLAEVLLNTGYINVNFAGATTVISLHLIEGEEPEEYYSISIYNLVPRDLNNVQGVDSLSWGRVVFSLTEDTGPPPCGPEACPTANP